MPVRRRSSRLCYIVAISGLLILLGLSSDAWSQQIPCPVTTAFTNSGTATNAESPCDVNAAFTNSFGATLENQAGGTLVNYNTVTNNGGFTNDDGGTLTNYKTIDSSGMVSNDGAFTNRGTFNNTGQFYNGDYSSGGTLLNYGTISNSNLIELNSGPTTNNGTIINRGTFVSGTDFGVFTNNGGIVNASGSSFINDWEMINNGTVSIKAGSYFDNASCSCGDGSLLNNGVIIVSGMLFNDIVNPIQNIGTFSVAASGSVDTNFSFENSGTLNNHGTLSVIGSLSNSGKFTNEGTIGTSSSPFEGPSIISNSGKFANSGTINLQAASDGGPSALLDNDGGTIRNSGTINNGGTITNEGILNITTGGMLNNLAGSTYVQTSGRTIVNGTLNSVPAVQIQGGKLSGSGTINGNVVMGGTIAPGNSPGILTINGNYMQTATGVYDAEIAGLTPGLGYDELLISGAADLNGKLDVTFEDGFKVALGDNFLLMKYNSETGTYSKVDLPTLSPGLKWDLSYDPGYLDLSVSGTVSPTPEPSTLLLWGTAGLLGIGIWARRRFSRSTID